LTLAILAAVAPSGTARADAAAKAFLEKIYATYQGKNSKGFSFSDAQVRLSFEPTLAALMIKDSREAARHHDVGALESDPFIVGQDWEIGPVTITVTDTAPDRATATAKFENLKRPKTVVYDLVKLKQGWRIAGITWQEDDGTTSTLRGIFVKK
jgi:hypothetical protein